MVPGDTPGFLEIGGGPYSDPVGVYAYPTGAAARWDVDALGDREVVHVDGAAWVVPDPTIYSAAQTVRESGVRTGNWNVPAWTNPGRGVPSRGLGGHAWAAAIQVLAGMWNQAGMEVQLKTSDQTTFISDALVGNYQANLWRQFGAPDPDTDLIWWQWKTVDGDDNILNFARLHDQQVDDALLRGRTSIDEADRKEAYADFQHRLSELIPYIWLGHSVWVVAADQQVRDITNGDLPDGSAPLPMGGTGTFGGTHRLTQVWMEE